MMESPAHPSSLKETSSSTRLEKIARVKKWKPWTDRRAINGPSSLPIDGNSELEKKASEEEAKC